MRLAAQIEYDGGRYAGWQIQDDVISVQGVVCAGRTDTGVHATCQIVHFESNVNRSMRGWTLGANTSPFHGFLIENAPS